MESDFGDVGDFDGPEGSDWGETPPDDFLEPVPGSGDLPEVELPPEDLTEAEPIVDELPETELPAEDFPEAGPVPGELSEAEPPSEDLPEAEPIVDEFPETEPPARDFPESEPVFDELLGTELPPEDLTEAEPIVDEFPDVEPFAGDFPEAGPVFDELPEAEPRPEDLPEAEPTVDEFPEAEPPAGDFPRAEPFFDEFPEAKPRPEDLPRAGPIADELPEVEPPVGDLLEPGAIPNELPEAESPSDRLPEVEPAHGEPPKSEPPADFPETELRPDEPPDELQETEAEPSISLQPQQLRSDHPEEEPSPQPETQPILPTLEGTRVATSREREYDRATETVTGQQEIGEQAAYVQGEVSVPEAQPEALSTAGPEAPVGPERQEIHKSAESLPEQQPGGPVRPSWDGPPGDTQSTQNERSLPSDQSSKAHPVPATVLEQLDTLVDEKKTAEIAASEYPHTSIEELPPRNLQGVAFEGMTQRQMEDTRGAEHYEVHPKGMTVADGRAVRPDGIVRDEEGKVIEVVDAKGYSLKQTKNPEAAASSLTHVENLRQAAKYTEISQPSVEAVTFTAPAETANKSAVQEAVAGMGTERVPVSMEAVGTEAELKQRVDDLQTEPSERFQVPDHVLSEIERIQGLPVEERRAAMGEFVQSLTDTKGDETTESRNLRWNTRIERNGDGITLIGSDGTERTVWYTEKKQKPAS